MAAQRRQQMIRFFLLQNRAGKTRLAKYYVPLSDDEKTKTQDEVYRHIANRDSKFTNFLEVGPLLLVLAACHQLPAQPAPWTTWYFKGHHAQCPASFAVRSTKPTR